MFATIFLGTVSITILIQKKLKNIFATAVHLAMIMKITVLPLQEKSLKKEEKLHLL
jgi:hypothetical protein